MVLPTFDEFKAKAADAKQDKKFLVLAKSKLTGDVFFLVSRDNPSVNQVLNEELHDFDFLWMVDLEHKTIDVSQESFDMILTRVGVKG